MDFPYICEVADCGQQCSICKARPALDAYSATLREDAPMPPQGFFVVLDEAPIKGSSTPKYDLMYGDFERATGFIEGSGRTIKELLARVPAGEPVYRTYLTRTDGKTGFKQVA